MLDAEKISFRIFVDVSSVEVFVNNGEEVFTGRIFPGENSNGIRVFARGGQTKVKAVKWSDAIQSLFVGNVKAVVYTKGAAGADLFLEDEKIESRGYSVKPVDTLRQSCPNLRQLRTVLVNSEYISCFQYMPLSQFQGIE